MSQNNEKNLLKLYEMFKRFFITEKTVNYELLGNTVTFMAPRNANKSQLKHILNSILGQNEVISIRSLNTAEKYKRKFTKSGIMHCKQSSEKKMIIRLKSPEKLKEILV